MGYKLFYLVTGVFILYTWYVLVSAFSKKQEKPIKKLALTMTTYYILSNLTSLYVEIVMLNLILTISVVAVMAALLNDSVKKIVGCVIRTILILMGVDLVVFAIEGFYIDSVVQSSEYHSVVGRLMAIVIVYSIGIGIRNLKHIRKDVDIPWSYWLTLAAFPLISILVFQLMLRFSGYESDTVIVISSLILGMNFIVFLIYDHLLDLYEQRYEDLSLFYLNESYKKQLITMTNSVASTNSIQHDISRHIMSVYTLMNSEKYQEAESYLMEIRHQFDEGTMLCRSGNTIIDSIVNYEFSQSDISSNQVNINVTNVPNRIMLSEYELTIILSNLLRNAFQAVSLLEEGEVGLEINYDKGLFFLRITNDYDGVIIEDEGILKSRFSQDLNKGLGLENVKTVVGKHDGDFELIITDTQFKVEVLLYTRGLGES